MGWPRSITPGTHGPESIELHCLALGIAYPPRGDSSREEWTREMFELMEREPAVKERCNRDFEAVRSEGPGARRAENTSTPATVHR